MFNRHFHDISQQKTAIFTTIFTVLEAVGTLPATLAALAVHSAERNESGVLDPGVGGVGGSLKGRGEGGFSWENHGKMMGKPYEHGKIRGKMMV